ncbi:MAG: hypothetical protein AB7N69_11675 [Immundisolibacter sp.]|uniref:hypothetical protein n=1 Tax=Immundisolibacter sp. TaxID=1934948 RepID=UPI003D0BBB65
MRIDEWIQTGLLAVGTLSLAILAWQAWNHNTLLRAQILRDRFDMYWRLFQPVSDEQIKDFAVFPQNYMDLDRYRTDYQGKPDSIRRYIHISMLYEYLAFTFTLHHTLKVHDPLRKGDWGARWTRDLIAEKEFMHVNDYYGAYYPDFRDEINNVLRHPPRRGPSS